MMKSLSLGFSFLELIVAIALLGVILIAASSLFFTSIRGGGKVDVSTQVRQNGQYALGTMEQLIRNASKVTNCTPGVALTQLVIVGKDSGETTFSCEEVDDGDSETGYIASNSARLVSERVVVTACEFRCSDESTGLRAPLVNISFTVRQLGEQNARYQAAEAKLSTAVGLRSY